MINRYSFLLLLLVSSQFACTEQSLEDKAKAKIQKLQQLMDNASQENIDITREETLVWFSKEFLKFANWDESNMDKVEKLFGYYGPYENDKRKYAEELPDLERTKVIEMLDKGISVLKDVLDGHITRRAVAKIDWKNIVVGEDMLLCNGKPVFLFDYFSKTVGSPLTNTDIYNDHLGSIYHGGRHLYDVNEDRPINPFVLNEDGTFDEETLDKLREIPNTHVGFLLFWNMGMPQWIHDREPEVAKGRSLFTGFDVDNPLMRDVWSQVIGKTGEMTKGKKVTQLGYIFSNEPHWYSEKGHWTQQYSEMNSISSYTLDKFRVWLQKKYTNQINRLNKNWDSSFSNFKNIAIEIPIDNALRGKAIWYDWCRFNMDRGTDWFTFIQDELHKVNPEADTHIKFMPRSFTDNNRSHGIDTEALTELTTMIGEDAKVTGGRGLRNTKAEKWEEKYSFHWEELAHSSDFLESVAPDKIHINSEAHFLSTSQWKDLHTSPDYVRSSFWLATLHGADAAISWFWARDADGSPEDRLEGELDFFDPALGGSYAGSANMQPQTVNEVAQVYMDMNSFSEEIMALRKQRRPVRLFHSETSAINKEQHMTEQFKLYESLYFEGFPIGFATEKIINKQDNEDWDVVVIYKTEYVTNAEFDAIQNYIDSGGHVIIDAISLKLNEYGEKRNRELKQTSGRIDLIESDNLLTIKQKAIDAISNSIHDVILSESNGTGFNSCTWRVAKNINGKTIMTVLNLGKNTAKLNTSFINGKGAQCTNMLTGQHMGSAFELRPKGVLLLELKD